MTSKRLLDPETRVLLDAADYIETYGHHKGNFADWRFPAKWVPLCAIGAISTASKGDHPAASRAINRLSSFLGTPHIVGWNDTHERTKEEVIVALRAAALAG